ncbi:MAG: flagellar basal body-associated FliL family protein [Pontibacterium sp.]
MIKRLIVALVAMMSINLSMAEEVPIDYVNYIELKPILVNYGGPGKSRFIKAEVTIQVSTPAAHHAINFHMPHIRNDLVFFLTDQTLEAVGAIDAQQNLSKQALKIVQNILVEEEGEAFVSDLFFTSFITQ